MTGLSDVTLPEFLESLVARSEGVYIQVTPRFDSDRRRNGANYTNEPHSVARICTAYFQRRLGS